MVRRNALVLAFAAVAVVASLAFACGDDDDDDRGLGDLLGGGTPTATATEEEASTSNSEVAGASATSTPGGPTEYEIQPGDTLSSIAARYDTTVLKIVELNGIEDPAVIFPGDVIRIPQ